MALQVQQNTNLPRFQPHFAPLQQQRPMLLKDFLRDDPCTTSSPPSKKSNKSSSSSSRAVLIRSWSERAAATRISAVHKVIKLLHLATSKSPSVLPRSISRRLTKRLTKGDDDDVIFGDATVEVKVKVKDILRWRSFRDLVEDGDVSAPLDSPAPSPHRSTFAATTTTTTSCSKRSSWCDSDFTAEELPSWGGENEEFWGKNASTFKNHKGDWSSSFEEEYEQQSPVSVLDSPFRQIQDFTHFHPILSKIDQRAKCDLTRRIQEVNVVEEKAKQLLSQIKGDEERHEDDDRVMLDFFMDELSINENLNDDELDCKILRIAESWIEGEFEESYEWDLEEERESFVKDMERGVCWNKFKLEQQELCEDLEATVLDHLIDDLVADFLFRSNETRDIHKHNRSET